MPGQQRRVAATTLLLTAVVVLANVLGNFSLSWGMKHSSEAVSPLGIVKTVFTPFVLLGIGLLILWLLTRLTLLSRADLSFVLPVTAVGYVLTAIMGRVFLAEEISWQRWAGTLLIVAGTALVGSTNPKSAEDEGDAG
jgi:uncharacterized membrane protein